MKRVLVMCSISVILASGCAARDANNDIAAGESDNSFCEQQYPAWACGEMPSSESGVVYGLGISPSADDFPDEQRAAARRSAYAEIVQTLRQEVTTFAQDYFEEQRLSGEEEANARAGVQSAVEQFAQADLVGADLVRQDMTKDGRWIVLMAYDVDQDFDRLLSALDHNASEAARRNFEDNREEFLEEMQRRSEGSAPIDLDN